LKVRHGIIFFLEMEGLTLGDVANVRRQQRVLGETLAPEQFLWRLRAEWELKSNNET